MSNERCRKWRVRRAGSVGFTVAGHRPHSFDIGSVRASEVRIKSRNLPDLADHFTVATRSSIQRTRRRAAELLIRSQPWGMLTGMLARAMRADEPHGTAYRTTATAVASVALWGEPGVPQGISPRCTQSTLPSYRTYPRKRLRRSLRSQRAVCAHKDTPSLVGWRRLPFRDSVAIPECTKGNQTVSFRLHRRSGLWTLSAGARRAPIHGASHGASNGGRVSRRVPVRVPLSRDCSTSIVRRRFQSPLHGHKVILEAARLCGVTRTLCDTGLHMSNTAEENVVATIGRPPDGRAFGRAVS